MTGKVLLLQIQGDAQSLLRFLFGSGWEASSGAANNFPATALSYLYTRSEGFGDEGKRSAGFRRASEQDPCKSALKSGISVLFFVFNLAELTQGFWCAVKY